MIATSPSATPGTASANPSSASRKSAVKVATKPAAKAASAKKPPVKATRKTTLKAPKSKPSPAQAAPLSPPAKPNKDKTSPAKTPQPQAIDKKKPTAPAKAAKEKKIKVVRDSFTLPKTELLQITEMKKRAMALGVEVKKSELIRAGLQALAGMADTAFKKAMANVPTIKTGRPAKD